MKSFLISLVVMACFQQNAAAAEPSAVLYKPEDPGDYALQLQGFPGYSQKQNRLIYKTEVAHGAASSEFFDLHIVDARTLQQVKSFRLDTRPTVKAKQDQLKLKLAELGRALRAGGYEQMMFIPEKGAMEKQVKASTSTPVLFEYSQNTGQLKILNATSKKELGKKNLPKLQQDCGPNGSSHTFPNSVELWSTNDQTIFLIEMTLAGASDSCLDPTSVELMKGFLSGK